MMQVKVSQTDAKGRIKYPILKELKNIKIKTNPSSEATFHNRWIPHEPRETLTDDNEEKVNYQLCFAECPIL